MTIIAYLDPVTGSAIMQVLLGALAVVGLGWQYVRRGFNIMMARLRGESGTESHVNPSASEPSDEELERSF